MVMVVKSLSLRLGSFAGLLLALAMIVLFVGPFWWPGESSSWAAFIRATLVLALLCAVPGLRRRSFHFTPLAGTVLVLIAYLILNSLFADDSLRSFRRLLLIVVFILGVGLIKSDGPFDWKKILQLSVLVVAGFAAFSMLNLAAHGAFMLGYRQMSLSSSGVATVADFGNTIVAGMNYGFFLLAGLWLMLRSRHRGEFAIWLLCCALIALYVFFTFARTAWVATIVGGFTLMCMMTTGKVRRNILLISAAIAVIILLLGFRELLYEVEVRGVTNRDEVWRTVFERLSGHWWFGMGAGSALGEVALRSGQVVRNTHGLYFEVLYQFGIVGVVLLMATMAHCAFRLLCARMTSEISRLWLALLCAIAVVMMVELHTFVGSPSLVWEWLWLPIAGALSISREVRRVAA